MADLSTALLLSVGLNIVLIALLLGLWNQSRTGPEKLEGEVAARQEAEAALNALEASEDRHEATRLAYNAVEADLAHFYGPDAIRDSIQSEFSDSDLPEAVKEDFWENWEPPEDD